MIGKAWVVNAGDGGMGYQPFGYRLSVRAVTLHPHRKRFDAADGEPGIHWAGNGTDSKLEEGHLLGNGVMVRDDGTTEHVGMPTQVFGRRVGDDIGAECERILQVGRGERVVDHDDCTSRVADFGERSDVADLHQRVARCLDPEHCCAGCRCRPHRCQIGEIDDVELHPPWHEDAIDQTMRSAIDIAAHDNV